MSQQTPEATPGQTPPPAAAVPTPPPGDGKQPPWGKPEDFNPDKAWELIQNLRKERGGASDPALKQELESLRTAQQAQQEAFARALGLKPEETSDTERLTSQLTTLQQQILSSERRALAAEHKIPEEFQHLLTAADSEGLKKQAEALVQFANAAHHAAATTQPPPAFQANPGQGQGGGSLTPEAQAAAEYEKYYPSTATRR